MIAFQWAQITLWGAPIASAGMTAGFWDAEGLRAVKTPVFFVAGSLDTTSGYENGVAALFEQSTNVDRVLLARMVAKSSSRTQFTSYRESLRG